MKKRAKEREKLRQKLKIVMKETKENHADKIKETTIEFNKTKLNDYQT